MYRKCLKNLDLNYLSVDVLNREWIASAVIGMLQRKVSYGRSPGLVVMGETHDPKVLGSNPGTINWMDIFSYLFFVKICSVCLKRPKINEKRPGLAHFLKKCHQSHAWSRCHKQILEFTDWKDV